MRKTDSADNAYKASRLKYGSNFIRMHVQSVDVKKYYPAKPNASRIN